MAATGTLDNRHKVVIGSIGAVDDVVPWYILELVGIRESDAFQHLSYEVVGGINEFIHGCGRNWFLIGRIEVEILGIASVC
jgi:hypothetical protein